jgi:AraC-like DNA-binding protein/ligand-binding sensor protein
VAFSCGPKEIAYFAVRESVPYARELANRRKLFCKLKSVSMFTTNSPAVSSRPTPPSRLAVKPVLTNQDRKLAEALQSSTLYRDYQQAFRLATGMSMFFRLAHTEEIPREVEKGQQNAFCQAMGRSPEGQTACSRAHCALRARSQAEGCGGQCFARMMESAVPLQCGGATLGWLWTGQVFLEEAEKRSFNEVAAVLSNAGCDTGEIGTLRQLWQSTPRISEEKYRSVVVLLEAFARQLGELANRLVIESRPQEPAVIARARRFIHENLDERLTLEEVARAGGLSPHHFCKVFRKAMGLNLIDYINRCRIERAKEMLLKQDARVSEVAFEIGYQSLSQFNRSFRNITGESPTGYRRRLLKPSFLRRAA